VSEVCCGIGAIELTREPAIGGSLGEDMVGGELCSALHAGYASCAFVNKGGRKAKGFRVTSCSRASGIRTLLSGGLSIEPCSWVCNSDVVGRLDRSIEGSS
jgi:hypothetical protein